jgi:uncharacterized BrkB/YihY/UPF0761 family membrane protein
VALLLTRVFYYSQIVVFGAEFTHAVAAEHDLLLYSNRIEADSDKKLEEGK